MIETIECRNCKWWDARGINAEATGGRSMCRRHAPSPYIENEEGESEFGVEVVIWPLTYPDDFCGEFAPNVQPE